MPSFRPTSPATRKASPHDYSSRPRPVPGWGRSGRKGVAAGQRGCFPTKNRGGKTPQIMNFNRVFPYKPSILVGFPPYFWKHQKVWKRMDEPRKVPKVPPNRRFFFQTFSADSVPPKSKASAYLPSTPLTLACSKNLFPLKRGDHGNPARENPAKSFQLLVGYK